MWNRALIDKCKSSAAFTQAHTSIKCQIDSKYFQLIYRRACTESTLRWPTTGTGLTQRLIRTEGESFAIRGNVAVIYN